MITHVRCDQVADVDKFLNKAGLKVTEVQITHVTTGYKSFYMVFFDDPELTPKKKTKVKAPEVTSEPEVSTESV